MRARLVLLGALFFISCLSDDEDWRERLNGTFTEEDAFETLNCVSTEYPDWETSEYNLPYPSGAGYIIGLGHCGGSYHSAGMPDQFAIDFNMPIGEKVVASRGGRVLDVEEGGLDGGFPNNFVLIEHPDGTYGWYMHLTHNGAVVNIGDNVSKGTLLGYSGNTGLAGYPHLHLVFTFDSSWPYHSFPTTFKNTTPNERSLQSGVMYTAY